MTVNDFKNFLEIIQLLLTIIQGLLRIALGFIKHFNSSKADTGTKSPTIKVGKNSKIVWRGKLSKELYIDVGDYSEVTIHNTS